MKTITIKIIFFILLGILVNNIYPQWLSQSSGTSQNLVSVMFVNTATGWAAGESGTILKTTNGGLNWVQQTSPSSNALISLSFIDASTGYISGTFGTVVKTTNGGANWSSLSTGVSGALRNYFVNTSTGWACGTVGQIIKTTNGGTNWTAQTSGSSSFLLNVQFINSNTGWTCGQAGTMLATTNGGSNWSTQITGSSQNLYGLHFVNSLTGWTVGANGNIYKTTNGGANWTAQTTGASDVFYSVKFYDINTGWLSGASGKVYATSNGGANWVLQASTTTETLNSIFFSNQQKGWACGTNGKIIYSLNGGGMPTLPWSEQFSGVTSHLYSVSTVNSNTCWAGGTNGVVLRTTNGGTTWTNVSGSPIGSNIINLVYGLDANTCIAATNTNVYKTTNAGANWSLVFNQPGGFINDIAFINASTGFMYGDAVGGRWSLWRTTNSGTNWDSTGLFLQQSGSELGWYNSMCISGNNIWFGTDNSRIYRSTNFGTNWSFTATQVVNSYLISFSGTTGFMSSDSLLMKSTNSGVNWSGSFLPYSPNSLIYAIANASGKWWVSRGDTIYTSTNGGTSFVFQRKGDSRYYDMSFVTDGSVIRGWAVRQNGGIDTYYEAFTSAGNNTSNIPGEYLLSQNYPNPFNPSTKIKFELPSGSSKHVKLAVYDILGKEISVLVNSAMQAGSYEIEFNGSNLASGVYFYRIDAGEFSDIKKMILIK